MKDYDWSWTLLGADLVSLESLNMIFMFRMEKYGQNTQFPPVAICPPPLVRVIEHPEIRSLIVKSTIFFLPSILHTYSYHTVPAVWMCFPPF